MKKDYKTLLAYLAVCFFWGSTYLAIKIGVKDFSPMLFGAARFIIAGSLMLIYAKIKKYPLPKGKKDYFSLGLSGLLMLLGGNGLVIFAEQWMASGITALLIATVPLFITLQEAIIFREQKPSFLTIIGLLLGFGGVYYLASSEGISGNSDLRGILMVLSASFFWALGSLYSRNYKTEYSLIPGIGLRMIAGGLGMLLVAMIRGEFMTFTYSSDSVLALFYLIFFGSIVGYSSYIYVLSKWPAAKAGTYAYVNPAVAVLLGALILHEKITLNVVVSLAIIIFSIILVQKSKIVILEPKVAKAER